VCGPDEDVYIGARLAPWPQGLIHSVAFDVKHINGRPAGDCLDGSSPEVQANG
jgi:hypothetical protein